jgi:hypothetical protein
VVIVVFAGMPLPMMICPALGTVENETLETVVDPVVVVAPRLVSVKISEVFVDVALADIVSCCVELLTEVTYALAAIPGPAIVIPTTMLLRLDVVPLMLAIVAEPLVVLPAILNVSGWAVCAWVGVADSVTVLPLIDETVVAGEVGMPLLVLVTTIPATTQVLAVLPTEVTVLPVVVQVPLVEHVVGSV